VALLTVVLLGSVYSATGQVRYDQTTRLFRLDGGQVSYIFGVNEEGQLQSVYWGGALGEGDQLPPAHSLSELATSFDPPSTITPQEYPGWGSALYDEPAIKITFADGNRDLVLKYQSYKILHDAMVVSETRPGDVLQITLRDIERDVFVQLRYAIDSETGILTRSASVQNRTQEPILIEQMAAAAMTLPRGSNYMLSYLTGRWAGEFLLHQEPLGTVPEVLESRRGSTSHQVNPWFAITRPESSGAPPVPPEEEHGDVWFGALGWSGSWRITVEKTQAYQPRITGGYNPFDFGYRLKPGETLNSPAFYAGYTAGGMGEASRLMHRFDLAQLAPRAAVLKPHPVIYNSWEATGMAISEAKEMALAEKAASIGVERFAIDDGWFGARDDDHRGLGDWWVNPKKFPHGLKPLIDRVHALGMDFGLWVEPEGVNPDSDLYRAHPDWVLNFTGRPRSEARNQLVLNMARDDVRDYMLKMLDRLLTENEISYLRWDYNRNWSEPGWPEVAPEDQKQVYVKYVENVYYILDEIRRRHPNVDIESCSGGGGRVDLGILTRTDQAWPSDDTDAYDRLTIYYGFTQVYSPWYMDSWVTNSPNWQNHRVTSLDYRFLSAMQGALGVGANLQDWTQEDFQTATRMITAYKQLRPTIQFGSLYRLIPPVFAATGLPSPVSATEYIARDGSQLAVFAFLGSSHFGDPYPTLYLRGLDPKAMYRIKVISGNASDAPETEESGAYWMNRGFTPALVGDFQAALFVLERVPR
jgi:alpha-galactosidase